MKKIAICGKGGSGKTVVTSLLALGLRKRGIGVLVIDSDDSNPGLHRMLGFDQPPEPLVDFFGGKAKVEEDIQVKIRAGIPEHKVNVLTRPLSIPEVPSQYVRNRDGISFISIGKIFMVKYK